MTANVFIDTNLLVYAYDISEPEKRARATDLLNTIAGGDLGAISTQVLVEFTNAITRKIPFPLSAADAYGQVEEMVRVWRVLELNARIVLEAVRGMREYGFSIWDAQIWATARLNDISIVLSEDFNSGAEIEGVRFLNPLLSNFDIKAIIET
jgi:predicted nucleic acid-binding protein